MKKKILILEDEPTTVFLLSYFLSSEYDLTIYENGLDGLTWLEQGNHPDLIITDLEMPKMDGFEFVNAVWEDERFRSIKILVTSSLDEEYARKRIKFDCDYLQKSSQIFGLRSRISNMLIEA